MKIYLALLFASVNLLIISCQKENESIDLPSHLIGKWNVGYTLETYSNDTLRNTTGFDFQLQLKKDGTGSYGFPITGDFYTVFWSTAFDFSKVFITIEDTSNPPEKRLLTFRMDVLKDEVDYQLWSHLTKRGGGPGFTELSYWDMHKQ